MIDSVRSALLALRSQGAPAGEQLSVIINDDPLVGEYSFSDPVGIRSESYEGFSRSYAAEAVSRLMSQPTCLDRRTANDGSALAFSNRFRKCSWMFSCMALNPTGCGRG